MSLAKLPQEIHEFIYDPISTVLRGDITRWQKQHPHQWDGLGDLAREAERFFTYYPEFRTQLDYRLAKSGLFGKRPKVCPEYPRLDDFHIQAESIGPGFFPQHGYGTYLLARSIGSNFTLGQNATVGQNGKGKPAIGDNCRISTGAVVVGPIQVGSNVHITANAVVNFDVPDDTNVYPARSVIVHNRHHR